MVGNRVDALVIFGATGDLAKLETFPRTGRAGVPAGGWRGSQSVPDSPGRPEVAAYDRE